MGIWAATAVKKMSAGKSAGPGGAGLQGTWMGSLTLPPTDPPAGQAGTQAGEGAGAGARPPGS